MNINPKICDPAKRYDFVFHFDVADGNPNGDPDAGNLPRLDLETMHGIVTDVCLKRKIRNYIDLLYSAGFDAEDTDGRYGIFVRDSGVALNSKLKSAAESIGAKPDKKKEVPGGRAKMCSLYYDIRLFGAVLSTGEYNCGQVRGPMQLTFSRSVSPVVPNDVTVTRSAITRKGEAKETEMGKKSVVPYGLYQGKGFFSPHLAKGTGLNQQDLELFWQAFAQMFEHDRSAARGEMRLRQAYVFAHDNPLGNAPSGTLFDMVSARLNEGVESPRQYMDYSIDAPADGEVRPGVRLYRLLE